MRPSFTFEQLTLHARCVRDGELPDGQLQEPALTRVCPHIRLTLEEEDALCVVDDTPATDQDEPDLHLMDEAPKPVSNGKARVRSLININASAAPAVYGH